MTGIAFPKQMQPCPYKNLLYMYTAHTKLYLLFCYTTPMVLFILFCEITFIYKIMQAAGKYLYIIRIIVIEVK